MASSAGTWYGLFRSNLIVPLSIIRVFLPASVGMSSICVRGCLPRTLNGWFYLTSRLFFRLSSTHKRLLAHDRLFSKEHEWVAVGDGGVGTVGISEHAQDQLGDIVYVSLPEVGNTFSAGDEFGSVESVKSASSLYCPVSGDVTEVNEMLDSDQNGDPSLVNKSPYDEGWIIKLQLKDKAELANLMDEATYLEFVGK